jgi:hypothetical protein
MNAYSITNDPGKYDVARVHAYGHILTADLGVQQPPRGIGWVLARQTRQ